MILWRGKPDTEKVIAVKSMGLRSWRRVLSVGWCFISLDTELRYLNRPWSEVPIGYSAISLVRRFGFGADHIYYDGPHCSWQVGFMVVSWSHAECEKCWSDE